VDEVNVADKIDDIEDVEDVDGRIVEAWLSRDYYLSLGPTFHRSSRNLTVFVAFLGVYPFTSLRLIIPLIIRCNFIQMNCLLRIALV
jgi:hypothetical protein